MPSSPKSAVQPPKTVVNSIVQGVTILRYLSETPGGHGVTAIAGALGLSASSCFNILRTLVAEELVDFDAKRKTYSLGYGLFELGRRAISRSGIFGLARPLMKEMVERYAVTGGLWRVTAGNEMVLIGVVENESELRLHLVVGQRVEPYIGASGRCLAALKSPPAEQIGALLSKARERNLPSLADYMMEIEETRLRGWAIDANSFRQGVTTVAAPVLDEDGDMRFALTCSMFSGQHSPAIVDRIGRETLDVANALSGRLFGTLQAA